MSYFFSWSYCKNQIDLIKKYGLSIFFYKIIRLVQKIFFIFLALNYLPIFFFIKLINFKILIRFGEYPSSRIGHMALESEIYLCKIKKKNKILTYDFFCMDEYSNFICNLTLYKLFKKKINIYPKFLIYPFIILEKIFFSRSKKNLAILSENRDRDINEYLKKTKQNIFLSKSQNELGNLLLSKIFKKEKNPKFVLLFVRDEAYLNVFFKNKDWSYHNYRDCEIENYIEACDKLTELGYYVFRMGHKVKKKLNSSNPKIIDYATNGMRTDFLDIFLCANCTFAISTSTGMDYVPTIFRKPVLCLNLVPVGYINFPLSKWIVSYKDYYSHNLKRSLTLKEIFQMQLAYEYDTKKFLSKKIEPKETCPKENVQLFLEMHNAVKNSIFDSSKPIGKMQSKFNILFKNLNKKYYENNFKNLHRVFNARISNIYLENRKNFLK